MPVLFRPLAWRFVAFTAICGIASNLSANSLFSQPGLQAEPEFLNVDEAFQLKSRYKNGKLMLYWQIAPDYFLYHHSLKVETANKSNLDDVTQEFTSSPAIRKSDPYFGQVGVYYHHAELESNGFEALDELKVSFRGCAEDGLCYPTQTKTIIVNN